MPFLFALILLGWSNMIASLRGLATAKGSTAAVHFLALTPLVAAFADAAYLSPANPHGVPGDARNWIPVATFLFGLASAAIFGWKFITMYRAKTDSTHSGWRAGISLACVVAGVYVAGTAIDHWMFFRDADRSGLEAAGALGADDVQCDVSVLVRIEQDGAEYRCPKSISLGIMSAQPFVPWPSYSAGWSVRLKERIEAVSRDAHAATEEQK